MVSIYLSAALKDKTNCKVISYKRTFKTNEPISPID
jgi:hypothetical protein